jgi:hypothetical protein
MEVRKIDTLSVMYSKPLSTAYKKVGSTVMSNTQMTELSVVDRKK